MKITAKTPITFEGKTFDLLLPAVSISPINTDDGLKLNLAVRFTPYFIGEDGKPNLLVSADIPCVIPVVDEATEKSITDLLQKIAADNNI